MARDRRYEGLISIFPEISIGRFPVFVLIVTVMISILRESHAQDMCPVLEDEISSNRRAEYDRDPFKGYWDELRCVSTDLTVRWDVIVTSPTSAAVRYEVKNKSRRDIHLIDRIVVGSIGRTYRIDPDAIIVQGAHDPESIDLIRGTMMPYGVKLYTNVSTYMASRLIKPGEIVQGRAILKLPLRTWYPSWGDEVSLHDARFIRLKLGYVFDGECIQILERRMDDGTVEQLLRSVLDQRQHFACSAALPWFFPGETTRR